MTRVRMDLFLSLDGRTSAPDGDPENPMGDDWGRLTAAYSETRTFRQQVFGDTSGAGTTGSTSGMRRPSSTASAPRSWGPRCSACTPFPTTRTGRAGGATSLRSARRSMC